jgi:hypothetical protein
MEMKKLKTKVFVVEDAPISYHTGFISSGQVAYGEKGEVVCAATIKSIIPSLINLGYKPKNIYFKNWINLDGIPLQEEFKGV